MKHIYAFTLLLLTISGAAIAADIPFPEQKSFSLSNKTTRESILSFTHQGPRPGFAGYYLAGRHAQIEENWGAASYYLDIVARKDPANIELTRRAMVVAMGDGDLQAAAEYAANLKKLKSDDPLAALFLGIESFIGRDYKDSETHLQAMSGGLADFTGPLMLAWVQAAQGKFNIQHLQSEPLSAFHVALIGKLLHRKKDALAYIQDVLKATKGEPSLKLADAFLILGEKEQARTIYETLEKTYQSEALTERLAAFESEKRLAALPFSKVDVSAQGLALAFLDMAKIFSAQDSYDSARIFAQIALALDHKQLEAHILLGNINAQTGQFDDAMAHYDAIPASSTYATDVQIRLSELQESLGHTKAAIDGLNSLYNVRKDIPLLIQIGDIQRRAGLVTEAIESYNAAIKTFTGKIPDEYWFIYYVRGMAYEREGQWNKAEADFKMALDYQPNNPFVLNYLAYGWAERNENLGKSLEYLEKASLREPQDGHIKDSLGWAFYKLGRFIEAIDPLEKAISYLPYDVTVNEHLGDAYWQVGRKREAMFQWRRALNLIETTDTEGSDRSRLEEKLLSGLPSTAPLKAAENKVITD